MFKNRWANLALILVLILLVVPAAYVYGLYVGETRMAKVFPDVERLGYRYGSIESIANTPLVGSVLAKGQCDGLRSADEDAKHVPQWEGVNADYQMSNSTPEIRKACGNP
jgi:hypothetical protein